MTDLTARRTALLAYAQSCLEAGDYHGCRDACTDLEVIEARLQERTYGAPDIHDSLSIKRTRLSDGKEYWPGCPCANCQQLLYLQGNGGGPFQEEKVR